MTAPDEGFLEGRACHGRGFIYRQLFCSGVASLLQMMQGCVLPLSSIILPQIQTPNEDFTVTEEQGSWFASVLCIGFLTGAIVGGIQCDYFGRRKSLMIDGVMATIGILIIACTQSYPLLIFARFLCGHASGSGTVAIPIYCSEISHPDIRSVTISFVAVFYYFGYCVTTLLGTSYPWRIATASIALLPLTSMVLLFFCPESPVWLIRHDREADADKCLLFFRGSESAAEEETQIILAGLLRQRKKNEAEGPNSKQLSNMIKTLKCPTFWRPFLIVFFLFTSFMSGVGCQW
uniref:Solute carrier family 2, facilitated glucose transporter member 8 n=1 Tax=Caligus clemensi TaxID=344056 RepID=C1C065_CALCM|nr:Solute carrier family 2, facilitated glucose transporter member 8 [Caligus clemensi]